MKRPDQPYIIVTGGAGFIGSCVIKELNNRGIESVVAVDELGNDEKWKNLVGKQLAEVIEKQDLFPFLNERNSDIEAIIHLGACSSTVETDASYLLKNNTHFSQQLADFALNNSKRFIYASSAATYGDGSLGFSDDHSMLETLRPLNMYGFSKHLFDLWLKGQGVLDQCVGLKYFNVFGPNEYHKGRMASAIYHMLPTAKEQGVVRLFKSSEPDTYADGGQMRDFIYVKDAAKMTCAFLDNQAGGIFNVGRGEPGTWNQVAEGLFKALNRSTNIEYIEMPRDLIGKYQNYTCADMTKTKSTLKESAECHELEPAIIDYVKNYLLKGATL